MDEQWRPIPSTPGYEASSLGRIRSVDRVVETVRGPSRRRGKVLALVLPKDGYMQIATPGRGTRKVHRLVAEAWLGPRPDGLHVLHGPGGQQDNRPSNLRYGTRSENMLDRNRDGTCWQLQRERCPRGHPLAEPNLAAHKAGKGWRGCLACHRASSRVSRLRRDGVEVDEVLYRSIADGYYAEIARCPS
jgi:hypothetical protein